MDNRENNSKIEISDEKLKQLKDISDKLDGKRIIEMSTKEKLNDFYQQNNLTRDIEKIIVLEGWAKIDGVRFEPGMTPARYLAFLEREYLDATSSLRAVPSF